MSNDRNMSKAEAESAVLSLADVELAIQASRQRRADFMRRMEERKAYEALGYSSHEEFKRKELGIEPDAEDAL